MQSSADPQLLHPALMLDQRAVETEAVFDLGDRLGGGELAGERDDGPARRQMEKDEERAGERDPLALAAR